MANLDEIKKKLMMKNSVVPQGWGKSVVGGKTVITEPSEFQATEGMRPQLGMGEDLSRHSISLMDKQNFQPSYDEEISDPNNVDQDDYEGIQNQMMNMKEGRMSVARGKDGEEFFVERDLTDPNSLYVDPETNEPFFKDLNEQNSVHKDFLNLYNSRGR